ncbi:MAG: metal-dependent hydrolase [Burkholderiaceae bacterium]|nr:metal-dependent hydrolase [Burkholderiaceae bacterium]
MMVFTHVVAGLFAGAQAVQFLHLNGMAAVWLLAGAAAGALLPDIDHPQSWLGRRIPWVSRPIAAVFGHRGITHSLLAVVGVALALRHGLATWTLGAAWTWVAAGVAAGYLSHLGGDFATHGGVPLLWPWKRRFSLPLTFQTGGIFEQLLAIALVGGTAWVLAGLFAPWAQADALALLRDWTALTARALRAS